MLVVSVHLIFCIEEPVRLCMQLCTMQYELCMKLKLMLSISHTLSLCFQLRTCHSIYMYESYNYAIKFVLFIIY